MGLARNPAKIQDMDIRIGNGYDVHALAQGLPLWLGGVKIESETGCVAHSDGDVAIHALCDALLGALALGDIGRHFPDSSDEFKGIDSKILLERTMEMVSEAGYRVGNADITIALQRPKLAPYIGNFGASDGCACVCRIGQGYHDGKARLRRKV